MFREVKRPVAFTRSQLRVAIVHDWLTRMGGAERVLAELLAILPEAELHVLVWNRGSVDPEIERRNIRTSFIQRLPWARQGYRNYLPLYPKAVESFDLSGYDLVISSSSCAAKGARARPGAQHLCYCHTPMRYVWEMQRLYEQRINPIQRPIFRAAAQYLRWWDATTVKRVNNFLANSRTVADRIWKYYRRQSTVVYPPVDTEFFRPSEGKSAPGQYYLTVAALVPYKRIDIAIAAFNRTGESLVVVGDGPERQRLEAMAGGNISFAGWLPPEEVRRCYRECRALVFPAEEDFGIAMAEAQACGKAVIAYGRGGAAETVIDGRTGVIFNNQTQESLLEALKRFSDRRFDNHLIRKNSLRFSAHYFRAEMLQILDETIERK